MPETKNSSCKFCQLSYTPLSGQSKLLLVIRGAMGEESVSMAGRRRQFGLMLVLAGSLCSLTGCFGLSHNPSYFPYYWPPGDIIPTHAKPAGRGYYANFDPYAVRIEVQPTTMVNPVNTQHVVLATVYDKDGKPRRKRRVEWMLSGEGHIIEVDESGFFPGRGYNKVKYAVSYTNFGTHKVTRGNFDPKDDFMLRPGQSWCVVSSAVEGDSYLTVFVPAIANWDQRMVVVNCKWVDAGWILPGPGVARTGTQHVFTTQVYRSTNKQPLANYRVRYKILDGPSAVLLPSQSQEAEVITDTKGKAQVAIMQTGPALGVNQVEVEILRPPDPTKPSASAITVAKGFTQVEWLAPKLNVNHEGPETALLGQEVPFTVSLTNTGKIDTAPIEARHPIPEGMQYVSSQPPAFVDGNELVWTLRELPPGQSHSLEVVFKAGKLGKIQACCMARTPDGLQDEQCSIMEVTEPRLALSVTGPETGVVGVT